MDTIVQVATILSPIIAVLLAWWTSRSSAKGTAREIAVMQENTEKEIQRLKELARLQVEAISTTMEMEMTRNRIISQQTLEESRELSRIMSNSQMSIRNISMYDFESRKSACDNKSLNAYLQELNRLNGKLNQIRQQLN